MMEAATELYPPRKELASDWSETAALWHTFGIELNLVNVSDLPRYVCKKVQTIDELRVTGDAMEWLARFLDVVGECLQDSPTADLAALDGLLPNQYRRLCSPENLWRDGGIPERLKDVSAEVGRDLRSRLLLGGVIEAGQTLDLDHLERAIEIAIPGVLAPNEVVDELIQHIASSLPEDEKPDEKMRSIATASVKLGEFLWDAHGKAASSWARQLPFISADGSSVRWTPHRMMMVPVVTWQASAQAFSHAYPSSRVLADFYAGSADGAVPNIASALVAWGIAHPDPISTDTPAELKERRLAAISREG